MNRFILFLISLFLVQFNLSAFNINEPDSLEVLPFEEFIINEYIDDSHFEDDSYPEITIKEARDTCAFYAKLFSVKNSFQADKYVDVVFPEEYETELFRIIEKGIAKDAKMARNIKTMQAQSRLCISESEDKRVRVYSWPKFGGEGYSFIIQYKIAPHKSRLSTSRSSLRLLEDMDVYSIYEVNHLQEGVYLLKGRNNNGTAVMGIDIISNFLYKSYVFDGEKGEPIAFKKALTLNEARVDDMKFISQGKTLEIPETMGLNLYTGKRAMYYYNGVFFDDEEMHQTRIDSTHIGHILRLTFRDAMWEPLSSIYPGGSWSLVADVCNDGTNLNSVRRDTISLRDDERGNKKFKFLLRNINGAMTLENLCFDEMYERDSLYANPTKVGLPTVTYACGKRTAFTYERLRYTAVCFDKQPSPEQLDLIFWAVEVDGKLRHLDKKKYYGNQIYLQMDEKWADKTIRVIPYIEKIDTSIYQETKIYAHEEAFEIH